jgi:hypothetical protein
LAAPQFATVTIEVTNSVPTAANAAVETTEDHSLSFTLTANDRDGDSLIFRFNGPSHGILTGTPPDLIYHPATNFFGDDGFTFGLAVKQEAVRPGHGLGGGLVGAHVGFNPLCAANSSKDQSA